MPPRITLVVLFGGRSAEHDVSRVTAGHVLRAVDPARYDVVPIAIDRDGRWLLAEDALAALEAGSDAVPDALTVAGPTVDPLPLLAGSAALPVRSAGSAARGSAPATVGSAAGGSPTVPATPAGPGASPSPAGSAVVGAPSPATDGAVVVALPLLHGPFGEDGTVQGLLELAGVPYVGAGVLSSALAMDKAKAKEVFAHLGLPQANWLTWRADELPGDPAGAIADVLGFPCFVKPANMGSSVGVSKVHDADELQVALELALSYDEWVVVEEAVTGREVELAVLGDLDPRVSVAGEIVPGAEFYDYEDKYHDGRAKLLIPAPLSPVVQAEFQRLALAAFRACRAQGMARVDFFYEEDGPARGPLLNEVNTIPGFTPISMYPKLWEASGLSYPALIDELVSLAIERHRRRAARTRTDR